MKKQPGVMLYFEIKPCLSRLSNMEKGLLFEAILSYGEYGEEPLLEGALGVAWDFIKPRLDRDRERYEEVSRQRSLAAKARWNGPEENANASFAMQNMPTTTSTPTSTSTSPSITLTAPPFSCNKPVENFRP